MVNRKIRFQMRPDELKIYTNHWESLYKTTEKDSLGNDVDIWDSTGEDHYVHATNYFRLGLERIKGGVEILDWQKQDKTYSGLAPEINKIIKEEEINGNI
jgi:hypothetical protein